MGMTQQQLADAVGIRFQQIQKYESGANRISAARLWSIAQALGAPVAFFYGSVAEEQGTVASNDPMDNKETFELVRAYYGMSERTRSKMLALAQAMNGTDDEPTPRRADLHVVAE